MPASEFKRQEPPGLHIPLVRGPIGSCYCVAKKHCWRQLAPHYDLDSAVVPAAGFLKPLAENGLETRNGTERGGHMSQRDQLVEGFTHPGGAGSYVSEEMALRPGTKVFGIACSVALGGFLVGYDAAVISGAVPFIRDYFALGGGTEGTLKLGWAVSCLGWGAMAGNIAAGILSDRLGRKRLLLLTSVLFLASALTAALSQDFAVIS